MISEFSFKKAQAGGAAALILVIALVLVIYISIIPTEDSDSIIGRTTIGTVTDDSNHISKNSGSKTAFSFNGPGLVDDTDEGREILLPSVNLKTRTNSKILTEDNTFYLSNSFFTDEKTRLSSFFVKDVKNTDNLYMSFIVKKASGVLQIKLNGFILFEDEIKSTNVKPIKISSALLKENNILEFSVSGVGLAFWKKNEYILDNFKVYGDITETSQQSSITSFELKPSEYKFLKRAKLKFYPDCELIDVDRLFISINGVEVFSQLPDCNVLNIFDLPTMLLIDGVNKLEFRTSKDSYLIDRISIETELEENDDLVYYFDLDEDFFKIEEDAKAVCGEIDGQCPDDCDADDDKDCCFMEYTDALWCDVPTSNENDRCVGRVDEFNVDRCDSGYEDVNGRPDIDFKNKCGDDTDGICPVGCSKYYDKDCCFETKGNYWCDDMPTNGFGGICVGTVTKDSCSFCPAGYDGEDGDPECDGYEGRNPRVDESTLKSEYDVEISLKFVDDNKRKRGTIRVNGYEIGFDTREEEVQKDISRFVEDGNNYAQILPANDFRLVSVDIDVDD